MIKNNIFGISIFFLLLLFACKKESLLTDGKATLSFSSDTIQFDTVFTTIGSITKHLKVYNNNDFNVLTNISLEGTEKELFEMNIDGISVNNLKNVEILANDSIFIFIEVRINPNNQSLPFIIESLIKFNTVGKLQNVKLVAYGQNAYFHTANTYGMILDGNDTLIFYYDSLDCNEVWSNDKPHVIYGYSIINPSCVLNIEAGTEIYLHKNSGIIIGNPFSSNFGGTIKVNGSLGNEVTFQGDRLDSWYKDSPGQWDRIWLMPGSIDNEFNHTIIRNGNIGIHADSVGNSNPTAIINNTIIENMSSIGIFGQGANLEINNTIVSNCGQYSVACNIGGEYEFTHCTFANYWDFNHRNTPSILLNNFYTDINEIVHIRDLNKANFVNCIIDGSLSTEIEFQKNNTGTFNFTFDHSLIKIDPKENTNTSDYINIIKNEDPHFVDKNSGDFHLESNSPAIDAGKITILNTDLEENVRDNLPDLGIYELVN